MTVLSKALTAETAEERLDAIGGILKIINEHTTDRGVIDAILREHFTNERTLFIAAGRGELSAQGVPNHMNPPKASDGGNTGADGAYKPGDADIAPGRTGQQTAPLPSEARASGDGKEVANGSRENTGNVGSESPNSQLDATRAHSAGANGAAKPSSACPQSPEAPKTGPVSPTQPLGPHDAGWQGVCTVEQLEPFLGPHLGLKTPQFTLWCTFKAGFYPKGTADRLEALRKLTDRQRALLKEAGV